jgi:predicted enzyme related to lactoylglutathione lyase
LIILQANDLPGFFTQPISMSKDKNLAEFRFYYYTNKYKETVFFYENILELGIVGSWDRGDNQRGTIFRSPNGIGLIEIEEGSEAPILQGALLIEVENVDTWYEDVMKKEIKIVQPLYNTAYGHRSFKFEDPNKLVIGLFKYV